MENATILMHLESLCEISFHHLTKEQNGYSYEMHVCLFLKRCQNGDKSRIYDKQWLCKDQAMHVI